MREYELIYIVHPDLDEPAFKELAEKVKGWITDAGGVIVKDDLWGRRRMAYEIKKQREGQYVFLRVQMDPSFGVQLERNIRLTEPVMRFLLTSV